MAEPSIKGRFVWQELQTADTSGAAAFYSKVVGWRARPASIDSDYTEFGVGSKSVAGMMRLPAGGKGAWMPYIGTDNVDNSTAAAERLGAKVCKAPSDIPTVGRFAVLNDPQGGTFALFTPAPGSGGGGGGAPGVGDFAWLELATTDHEAAFAFYRELFGWEAMQRMDMGPNGIYLVFGADGVQRGGMYKMHAQQGSTPYWLPYAEVTNADSAASTAVASGARIIAGPMDVPGGGRMAQLTDPSGVLFAVHSMGKHAAAPKAKKPAAKKAAAKAAPKKKATAKKKAAPKKKAVPKKKAAAKASGKRRSAPKKAKKKARAAAKSARRPARKKAGKARSKK